MAAVTAVTPLGLIPRAFTWAARAAQAGRHRWRRWWRRLVGLRKCRQRSVRLISINIRGFMRLCSRAMPPGRSHPCIERDAAAFLRQISGFVASSALGRNKFDG